MRNSFRQFDTISAATSVTLIASGLSLLAGGLLALYLSDSFQPAAAEILLGAVSGFGLLILGINSNTQRGSGSRSAMQILLLLAIIAWGLFQLLFSVELLTEAFRFLGYRFKNYFGAIVVVVLGFWAVLKMTSQKWTLTSEGRILMILALLFPFYAAITMYWRGESNIPLIGMYFLWCIYAYILQLALFENKQSWIVTVSSILITVGIGLSAGIVLGFQTDALYWLWTQRLSFVFSLGPYSHALSVLATAALAISIRVNSRFWKSLLLIVFLATLVLCFMAATRSALVYILIVGTSFVLSRSQNWRKWFGLVAGLALLVAILAIPILDLNVNEIDALSSNRLTVYSWEFGQHMSNAGPLRWLFGSSTFLSGERLLVLDTVGLEARYVRNQTDNNYLTLLLGHGLVGVIVFHLPIFYVARRLLQEERSLTGSDRKWVQLGFASLAGLLVQNMFTATLPSMGNMLSIFLPIFWIPALGDRMRIFMNKERR